MKLTYYQKQYKNKLYYQWVHNNKQELLFVAPTGSGKTFMIFNLIADIFQNEDKAVVIYQSLSKGGLAKQTVGKFKNYQRDGNHSFQIKLINAPSDNKETQKRDTTYHIKAQNHTVYVIGSQTLSNKSVLKTRGYWQKFTQQLKRNRYQIYFVWDEAHIGSGNLDVNKSHIYNSLKNNDFNFKTLYLTATPKPNEKNFKQLISEGLVTEFTLAEACEDFLIKTKCEVEVSDDKTDEELLGRVIKKFKEVRKKYESSSVKVRPALLIQIENKKNNILEEQARKLKKIENTLDKNGLLWFKWLSEKKEVTPKARNLNVLEIQKNLSSGNSEIDVIIFKQAVTEGWDIPRACMLLRLRNVQSKTLNVQTVGRIRRNPIQPLENIKEYHFAKKYYIFSNFSDDQKYFMYLKLNNDFKTQKFKQLKLEVLKKETWDLQPLLNENREKIEQECKKYLEKVKANREKISLIRDYRPTDLNNVNLLKIYQKFYDYYPNQIRRQLQKHQTNRQIPDWTWKLFWIDKNNDSWIKKIKRKTNHEQKYDQTLSGTDGFPLPENIILYGKSSSNKTKTKDNLFKVEIEKEHETFFPYVFSDQKRKYFYVDSFTEQKFITDLFLELAQRQTTKENIIITTKHFLPSNIFYEYIMEASEQSGDWPYKRSSYPDILLKINKNDATYSLVIEIKNKDQHDKAKVASLKTAYRQCSSELSRENYIFAICLYDTSKTRNNKPNNKHDFYVYHSGKTKNFETITELLNEIRN